MRPTRRHSPPFGTEWRLRYGPQVMQGYHNQPDATTSTLVNGWLHTGDIAPAITPTD